MPEDFLFLCDILLFMKKFLSNFRYTILFVLSIIVAVILYAGGVFNSIVQSLDGAGYATAFVAGFFYSISFTIASAGLFFVELGEHYNPVAIALLGGLGAMLADLLMFKFIKETIVGEMKLLFRSIIPTPRRKRWERLTKRRVFIWGVPFVASMFIASPLPDEIGVALFSLVNFRPKYLSIITFLLNTAGIFLLVFLGHALS